MIQTRVCVCVCVCNPDEGLPAETQHSSCSAQNITFEGFLVD